MRQGQGPNAWVRWAPCLRSSCTPEISLFILLSLKALPAPIFSIPLTLWSCDSKPLPLPWKQNMTTSLTQLDCLRGRMKKSWSKAELSQPRPGKCPDTHLSSSPMRTNSCYFNPLSFRVACYAENLSQSTVWYYTPYLSHSCLIGRQVWMFWKTTWSFIPCIMILKVLKMQRTYELLYRFIYTTHVCNISWTS